MRALDRLVLVGRFGAAQGVRGEVRVQSYTSDPQAIGGYGPLTDRTREGVRVRAAAFAQRRYAGRESEGRRDAGGGVRADRRRAFRPPRPAARAERGRILLRRSRWALAATGDGCRLGRVAASALWSATSWKSPPRAAARLCCCPSPRRSSRRSISAAGELWWSRRRRSTGSPELFVPTSPGSYPFSSFAGEGGAIGRRKTPVFRRAMAPDGVWPAAATLGRIARPSPRAFNETSCFPHPIRPFGPPPGLRPGAGSSPLRGEGGARPTLQGVSPIALFRNALRHCVVERFALYADEARPFGPVAQWLEPAAHNGLVAGSSPARPTRAVRERRSVRKVSPISRHCIVAAA